MDKRFLIIVVLVIIIISICSVPIVIDYNKSKEQQNIITNLELLNKAHLETINRLNDSIVHYNKVIDSLYVRKDIIKIQYETIYKDYNNPNIVSDDSIVRYIRAKIRDL